MNKRNNRALTVAAYATLAAVAFTVALPANAVDFKVSGQIDPAITIVDNGVKSDVGFVGNDGGNARFRFVGSQDLSASTKLGFTYELQFTDRNSAAWDVNSNYGSFTTTAGGSNRLANVWLKGDFGTIQFGKLWEPASGTMELEYSGTTNLGGGSDYVDWASSLTFIEKDKTIGPTLGSVGNEFDSVNTRVNGVTYYTPNLNGFSVGFLYAEGGEWQVVPRYEVSFGDGGKFGLSANYVNTGRNGTNGGLNQVGKTTGNHNSVTQYGASAAVLLPSGFNASLAYAKRKSDKWAKDQNEYYGSVGYRFGKNNLQLNMLYAKDQNGNGNGNLVQNSKFKGYGLAYVYNLTDSVDLYASYHLYTLKGDDATDTRVKFHDISQVFAGAMVRFL